MNLSSGFSNENLLKNDYSLKIFFLTNPTTLFLFIINIQLGIKLNIGLIPAIFLIVAILIQLKFPIDGSTTENKQMKNQLEKLHNEKLESFLKRLVN